jgi:hypothetical protein
LQIFAVVFFDDRHLFSDVSLLMLAFTLLLTKTDWPITVNAANTVRFAPYFAELAA